MQICAGSNPASGIIKMKNKTISLIILILLSSLILIYSKIRLINSKTSFPAEQLTYYSSGKFIRITGPTFTSAIADIAWMQIIQYYGEENQSNNDLHHLRNILFTLVEIDPNFTTPYTIGAFLLIDNLNDYKGAIELLNRGISQNPDKWEFLFTKGFILWIIGNHHVTTEEKEIFFYKARRLFYLASLKPDAPDYIFTFAAASAKKEGEHLLSAKLWFVYYNNAAFEEQKDVALVNIKREIIRYTEDIIEYNQLQNKITTLDNLNLPIELIFLPDNSQFILDSLGNPLWIE